MTADWLIIAVFVATFWIFWLVTNFVIDLLQQWYAAHRREAMQSDRERGSSLL